MKGEGSNLNLANFDYAIFDGEIIIIRILDS